MKVKAIKKTNIHMVLQSIKISIIALALLVLLLHIFVCVESLDYKVYGAWMTTVMLIFSPRIVKILVELLLDSG